MAERKSRPRKKAAEQPQVVETPVEITEEVITEVVPEEEGIDTFVEEVAEETPAVEEVVPEPIVEEELPKPEEKPTLTWKKYQEEEKKLDSSAPDGVAFIRPRNPRLPARLTKWETVIRIGGKEKVIMLGSKEKAFRVMSTYNAKHIQLN